MRRTFLLSLIAFLFLLVGTMSGCTTAPKSAAGRAALAGHVDGALKAMKAADPTLDATLTSAAGYAVFPKVGKGAIWLGAAYGRGEVFAKSSRDGYCSLLQITLGFQWGGQGYTQLIIFKTPEALASFKEGKFRFAANASAVATIAGVGATADYGRGATIYVYDPAGFMAEAALGVQNYNYVKE
jgi:lipid-binding SYLF domain-containing protein